MKEALLSAKQARVIGSMIEKQITTPQYYPMTVNAVRLACNQKSNRNPLVEFSEDETFELLEGLTTRGFVKRDLFDGSRTTKYAQHFDAVYGLDRKESAVLAELFLRGAQTSGELRAHCERMAAFDGIEQVEGLLRALAEKGHVCLLPRVPGQKEPRWAQLFSGEPEPPCSEGTVPTRMEGSGGDSLASSLEARVAALEDRMRQVLETLESLASRGQGSTER
jgi:uncharacterized protein